MRAGRLDRRISVLRRVAGLTDMGEPHDLWQVLISRRAASLTPLKGDERSSVAQYVALEQVEFRVRYAADVAALSPLDRIVYPAVSDDDIPETIADREIYDVLAVHEIGRREGLQIMAARRADTVGMVIDVGDSAEPGVPIELLWGVDNGVEWGTGNGLYWGES